MAGVHICTFITEGPGQKLCEGGRGGVGLTYILTTSVKLSLRHTGCSTATTNIDYCYYEYRLLVLLQRARSLSLK